jgi:DNA polymerase-3 subunit beta
MYTLTVSLATLRAARTHAAEKDVRQYLTGVYLDTATGKVVATDGHRLFVANARGVRCDQPAVIVPNITLDAALKQFTGDYARGKPLGAVEVAITVDGLALTITTPAGEVKGRTLDGKFPEWRRVVPKPDTIGAQVPAVLNPRYLTDACEAITIARNLSKKAAEQHAMRIHMRGTDSTIVADSGADVLVVIMPLRNDLHAETAAVACRMAHDDALAYSAETAANVAAEAA